MTGTSQYYRNIQTMKKCQANYDAMIPDDTDDSECPECGAEIIKNGDGWVCNEACGWSVSPDYESMLENKRGRE